MNWPEPQGAVAPWIDAAIAAVARWLAAPMPARDAVATALPRSLSASDRARAAAATYAVIRDRRRLEFVLRSGAVRAPEPAAAVLVLAHLVERGELEPAAASRSAGPPWTTAAFAALLTADRALAAIAAPSEQRAVRHSLPDWLLVRFDAEFGDAADPVLTALAATPPRTLRANMLRVSDRSALARLLAEDGVATAAAAHDQGALHAVGDDDLFASAAYRDGMFEQQDEGSQLIARAVAPPPGGRVLDACAGSGGKTLALAALLQNRGAVRAVDVHAGRIDALRRRARRAGADNVRAEVVPDDDWPPAILAFAQRAERILLDVPCSGTGSWRRRPEARWLLSPHDLPLLQQRQDELLDRAAAALRPGARIVYATCSLFRAENEARVEAAIARHPQLELVTLKEVLGAAIAAPIADSSGTFLQLRPDRHGTDGFFAAILRRRRR